MVLFKESVHHLLSYLFGEDKKKVFYSLYTFLLQDTFLRKKNKNAKDVVQSTTHAKLWAHVKDKAVP